MDATNQNVILKYATSQHGENMTCNIKSTILDPHGRIIPFTHYGLLFTVNENPSNNPADYEWHLLNI